MSKFLLVKGTDIVPFNRSRDLLNNQRINWDDESRRLSFDGVPDTVSFSDDPDYHYMLDVGARAVKLFTDHGYVKYERSR